MSGTIYNTIMKIPSSPHHQGLNHIDHPFLQLSSNIQTVRSDEGICPFSLWPWAWFPLAVCFQMGVSWRQSQSSTSNHEAGSDPARSLSGFVTFSSQGIFGIVSDTLILMGCSGCPWSAWISVLRGSVRRASVTWCNWSVFFTPFRHSLRRLHPLMHKVAYLWVGVGAFLSWRRARVTWVPLPVLSCTHIVTLNKPQCHTPLDVNNCNFKQWRFILSVTYVLNITVWLLGV